MTPSRHRLVPVADQNRALDRLPLNHLVLHLIMMEEKMDENLRECLIKMIVNGNQALLSNSSHTNNSDHVRSREVMAIIEPQGLSLLHLIDL
ncbi:hypothetical protein KEM48_008402 [Puccinia striiformis f. sp. tritici PST-130]|nr:hypothetical protein KEM48_008402 [Puccinia striiformis f. sp. tritici PST-130]